MMLLVLCTKASRSVPSWSTDVETVSVSKSHGGEQGVYRHASDACRCQMTFAAFMPPQVRKGRVPVLWYLSGLTCTHQNVMDKGGIVEPLRNLELPLSVPTRARAATTFPTTRRTGHSGRARASTSTPHVSLTRPTTRWLPLAALQVSSAGAVAGASAVMRR